jgi:hypothetical protein
MIIAMYRATSQHVDYKTDACLGICFSERHYTYKEDKSAVLSEFSSPVSWRRWFEMLQERENIPIYRKFKLAINI